MVVGVLGAGPAGSTAARALEERGFEVALLDRAEFPREKACGGVLPPRVLKRFDVPEEVLERRLEGYRVHSPSFDGVETRFPTRGGVARRSVLDQHLVDRVEAGVERFDAAAVEEREGGVALESREGERREFELLVAADGAASTARRGLGVRYGALASAHQVVLETEGNPVGDWFEVHYRFSRGYGWVAPLRSGVKVGVGGVGDGFTREELDRFVEELGLEGEVVRRESAAIPMAGPAERLATDRVLLAGDAGGFVFPGTGEGIYYGMLSGEAAARAAERRLSGESLREAYREECRAEGLLSLRDVDFLEETLGSPEAADRYVRGIANRAE